MFAHHLAEIFGTQLHIAHLDTKTSGDLVGSSEMYANSTPGMIFKKLVFGDVANPLILLDEIDKASGDDRFPTSKPLLNLLADTTVRFQDASQS